MRTMFAGEDISRNWREMPVWLLLKLNSTTPWHDLFKWFRQNDDESYDVAFESDEMIYDTIVCTYLKD